MVLGKTEYSNAVNARYTFQLLMSFCVTKSGTGTCGPGRGARGMESGDSGMQGREDSSIWLLGDMRTRHRKPGT